MPGLTVGAVCVYHEMVETAVRALDGSGIPVAAVSTGFPAGLSPWHLRVAEIGESVKRRGAGDRHRHLAPPCADRQLAGAL
jgi:deoxyribose-phosphate aldolase